MKMWICGICIIAGLLLFLLAGENLIGLYLHGESQVVNASLTMSYAKEYLAIMLFTFVPFGVTQIYASSLRETGESIKPMVAGIASVVIDVVFNYFLIYGKFGFPELGVRGAAIATLMARVVEMLVVVIWTHCKKKEITFINGLYRTLLVPKAIMGEMIKKGLPIFLNEFLWAGSIAALTQCYSTRGLEIVADFQCHLQPFKCCIYFSRFCRWYFERSDTRSGRIRQGKEKCVLTDEICRCNLCGTYNTFSFHFGSFSEFV